ncbi:hypothetical protein GCM10010404_70250 [Nonomuraea africana]
MRSAARVASATWRRRSASSAREERSQVPMPHARARASLVENEAERHQSQAHGRPPPADGERKALQGDHHERQRVEGSGRQVADLSPLAVERRQERCDGQQQPER